MANTELKLYAMQKDVRLWQVAERFGINDGNFSRKLRKEFTPDAAEKFRRYVDEIAREKALE